MPDIPSQAVLLGLAEQLSAEFCTRTSRTTIAALCTLLPGLKYYR